MAIVIGGSGFVGTHLLNHFLERNIHEKVIVGDLVPPPLNDPRITYIALDIREPIDSGPFAEHLQEDGNAVIYNLAAISRILGYPDRDYHETQHCRG